MLDLSSYANPALQFSGGKDSLACLYIFHDKLDDITVYHLDTGDMCPETKDVVESVKAWVPRFVTIQSDVKRWREVVGYPTDLVPAKNHELGVAYGLSRFKLSNRFDCCWNNLMRPMHDKMVADKVDAVIRGTKLSDTGKVPVDGATDYYDVLLPIKNWTHEDVFEYLHTAGAPINPIYEHFKSISAPECFGCTAWWDDGKASYLSKRHPEQYSKYRAALLDIAAEINGHMAELYAEIKGE